MDGSPQVQPGWYPDPSGQLRWWDGSSWGVAAAPPAAPHVPGPPVPVQRRRPRTALVAIAAVVVVGILIVGGLALFLPRAPGADQVCPVTQAEVAAIVGAEVREPVVKPDETAAFEDRGLDAQWCQFTVVDHELALWVRFSSISASLDPQERAYFGGYYGTEEPEDRSAWWGESAWIDTAGGAFVKDDRFFTLFLREQDVHAILSPEEYEERRHALRSITEQLIETATSGSRHGAGG